jgi:hypothetical protein
VAIEKDEVTMPPSAFAVIETRAPGPDPRLRCCLIGLPYWAA